MYFDFIIIYNTIIVFSLICIVISASWILEDNESNNKIKTTYQLIIFFLSVVILIMAFIGNFFWINNE